MTSNSGRRPGQKRFKVNMKRFIPFVLILVVVLLGAFALLRKPTTVAGYEKLLRPVYGKTYTQQVQVTSGKNRTILLQKKSGSDWTTVKTYSTKELKGKEGKDGKITTKVKVSLTKKDYGKKDTEWRILVKSTFLNRKAESETIKVQPMNIGTDPGIVGSAAIIMRAKDGRVMYGLNEMTELPNASTTKLLTALMTMETLEPDTEVPYTEEAAKTEYASLHAEIDDKYKAKDLWKALLVASSNDAAVALADKTSGTEAQFVTEMNARVKKMGLEHTHFQNVHGLDETEHYSSCYDLAMIDRECMKNETFRKDILMDKVVLMPVGKVKHAQTLHSTDQMVKNPPEGFLGGKTGTTTNAKGCFVSNYEYKGEEYVVVVLGSRDRWTDTAKLYGYIRDYC